VIFVVAVIADRKALAIVALVAGLFTPDDGSCCVARRRHQRPGGGGRHSRARPRDGAGARVVFGLLALAGFVTGMIFDLIDT
jgi:hypothetical protein